ncbi:MAG: zf-TFIIB domain-containing protein [Propionibacteriales bacterium]|nr:zf-TFIIB domain-containing protein [Propionibacteriales bacterium]
MEAKLCPQCQNPMTEREFPHLSVTSCAGCGGIFLARADLGALIEAENDWHAHQSANTAALPRITGDTPPPSLVARSRAYIETLFGA